MRSFVKPAFVKSPLAAKFGLATATSAAMVVAPMVVMPATAANISVTTCDADGASLLAAVDTANNDPAADVIEINISGDCTMTMNERIDIATSMTIKNINPTDSVTLSRSEGQGRVVHVRDMTSSIDVTLENLIISGVDGYLEDTRLISVAGESNYPSTFTIRNSSITDGDSGGLFVEYDVALTIENSSFTNNQQSYWRRNGAAIYIASDVDATITDSTFANNGWTAYEINGGAIYAYESTLTIENSAFNNNRAGWGGAVYVMDTDLTFEGESTVFSGNGWSYEELVGETIDTHAGAIDVHGESTLIANSPLSFDDNISGDGGAIHFKLEADTTVEFNDSVYFRDNFAQSDGGAIRVYSYGYQLDVEFNGAVTYFSGNKAGGFYDGQEGNGGAIAVYEDYSNDIYIADEQLVTFRFNSATTTFTGNYAEDDGGAIYTDMEQGFAVFDFIDEATPGAVFFTNNTADDDGSAIYLEGGDEAEGQAKLYLDGAVFTGNAANSNGTVYLEDAAGYVYNTLFSSNSAVDGGVFYLEDNGNGAYLRADYNKFINNSATGFGGVLYLYGQSNFNLNANVFWNNYAAGAGSVIYMDQANSYATYLQFSQNTVYLNYSDTGSGALTLGQASYGNIAFNTFALNSSSDGDLALQMEHNADDARALNIYGNIFASDSDGEVVDTGDADNANDLGFNLLTGPAGQSLNGGQTTIEDYSVALRDGRSFIVEWDQLALEQMRVNDDNPDNDGALETMALGPTSVAIDFLPTSVEYWTNAPLADARAVTRHADGLPAYGTGIDAGAFESIHTFVPQEYEPDEPQPLDPNVSITHVSKSAIQAAGDTITVYGRGLDDVTELYFNGTKVSFVKQADGSLLVTTPALPVGEVQITAMASDGTAVLQHAFWVVDSLEFSTWTRHVGDTIKIYAKNVIGRGKVQFFVDGKEIAWINAVDATDPKLRTANGYHYLVRTVQLKADGSKTRFEVKLNGERVRRNTYTINSN